MPLIIVTLSFLLLVRLSELSDAVETLSFFLFELTKLSMTKLIMTKGFDCLT